MRRLSALCTVFFILLSTPTAFGQVQASKRADALELTIDHTEVSALRFEAFEGENGELLLDSGLVPGHRLQLMDDDLIVLRSVTSLRYELRAWDADGQLVLSQISKLSSLGDSLFATGFETIPPGTQLFAGRITLQSDVEITGSLDVAATQTGELRDLSGGVFFGTCSSGSSIRSIGPTGNVLCEPDDIGGNDNLGSHRATQNILFDPQEGIEATGGARLLTGPLGGTWFAQAGAAGRYRFGARSFDAPPGNLDADFVIDDQGRVGIFTFTPQFPLDVSGNARFGSGGDSVIVGNDASNAAIEMRGAGTPYIDFSNDGASDFDMRLMLTGDNSLTFDGGRLGIGGTMTNPQYKIDLPNLPNPDGQGRANDWMTYSSARYKTNVQPIPNALEKLSRLRGVTFDWTTDRGGHHDVGFIAEEVGAVLPELVDWESNGIDAKAMSYSGVVPVLVEALKQQVHALEAQEARIAMLEQQLRNLTRPSHQIPTAKP